MIISVLITTLTKAGKAACLAHPKAKLYAKVNSEDNFCLAMSGTIEDVMMGIICKRVDLHDDACVNWWNTECNRQFKRIVQPVAAECYKELRA